MRYTSEDTTWLYVQTNSTAVSSRATLQQVPDQNESDSDKKKLNVEEKEFHPNRTAGAIALAKIKNIAEYDDSDND